MKRLHSTDAITRGFEAKNMNEPNRPIRITPPPKKRKLQFGQSSNLEGKQNTRLFEKFRQLNPSNPVEAKRINTRKKQIEKGKNTVGYDLYMQKVPKSSRKKIAEHPSTPDCKADIPNRRWLGQLKAWRIALHQYDPNDLKSDQMCGSKRVLEMPDGVPKSVNKNQSVKHKQIEDASRKGLNVDFDLNSTYNDNESQKDKEEDQEMIEGVTELNEISKNDVDDELDKWESNRLCTAEEELLDYDDSDDDIL